jgi:hypothetical protein
MLLPSFGTFALWFGRVFRPTASGTAPDTGARGGGAGRVASEVKAAQQERAAAVAAAMALVPPTPKPPKLSKKLELVCWVPLAPPQVAMYTEFLESDRVKEQLNSTRSPLAVGITFLFFLFFFV